MTTCDELISNVNSKKLETQISAIESFERLLTDVIESILKQLENSSNKFLFAERLSNIGYIFSSSVENFFRKSTEVEAKELSAIILFNMGNIELRDFLLDMISSESEHSILASRSLADKGIKEAINPIIKKLELVSIENIDAIVSLIMDLKKLNTPLPENLIEIFKGDNVPWQISSLVVTRQVRRDKSISSNGSKSHPGKD